MRRGASIALLLLLAAACASEPAPSIDGLWRAWLESPGGELPFHIELDGDVATIYNPPETIATESVRFEAGQLEIAFPHYDSRIVARLEQGAFVGEWTKTSGPGTLTRLPFHAERAESLDQRFTPGDGPIDDARFTGRWAVQFSEEPQPAVGEFAVEDGRATGTFLTVTGDYRFLTGEARGDRLRLSVFDGAHAFLFDARLDADGALAGEFWSRDLWYETWTAVRDETAATPDPFTQTMRVDDVDFASLSYPDLDGELKSLDDPAFAGEARLLVLFGTWCPNCNDASKFLVELDRRYRDRGLSILGLAFEMTGELERDAEQVRTYIDYQGIEYPILLAGTSEKEDASEAFPLVDRVRSFPTTIFIDGDGAVRAVYSGFSGPATGPAYERLRRQMIDRIEEMLDS